MGKFVGKHSLHQHKLRLHATRDHPSKICKKTTFACARDLTGHTRHMHNDRKTFACGTCRIVCRSKAGLNAHERIHSGTKPFTCCVCSRTFRTSCDMRRHMKWMHPGDSARSAEAQASSTSNADDDDVVYSFLVKDEEF